MTHWKPKLIVAVAAILLAAVPLTAAPEGEQSSLSPRDVLARMQAAYSALSSYSDEVRAEGSGIAPDGKTVASHATASVKLGRPNLYRIDWHLEPASPPNPNENKTVVFWSQGAGAYETTGNGLTYSMGHSLPLQLALGDATFVPSAFYGQVGPGFPLSPECCVGAKYVLGADEKVGDVECFVLRTVQLRRGADNFTTLWIGKSDYLLRQIRTVSLGLTSTETHSNIVMNVPMSGGDFGPSASN